uniref:polynucleotide adenylyltransferase n=1 Tax=Meloidogyne hapla TaxID=6305 RepID=A0A1I8B7E5_MELHA
MKGIIDGRHLEENKKEIILQIKKQLHIKNLALISEGWKDKIEGNKKEDIFKILFFEGNEGNINDKAKLNEDFELWEKYKKQKDLDAQKLDEYGPAIYLYPEYFQEINFETKNTLSTKLTQLIDGHSRDQEIADKAVKVLKKHYSRWSQIVGCSSKLLISGSVMLGINTINSDVDAIVILEEKEDEGKEENEGKEGKEENEINTNFNQNQSEELQKCKYLLETPKTSNCEVSKMKDVILENNPLLASLICAKEIEKYKEINNDKNIKIDIKEKRFNQVFGSENTNCQLNKSEECNDQSLFCLLCRDRRVTDLKRITEAWIQLIEFKIYGIDIDIAYVGLPEWPITENSVDWLNTVLASHKNNVLTKLQPISGYSSNKYLINLLNIEEEIKNNKMPITFCNALIALKVWAKNNSIYGNINGFFNGAALTLLVAKVYLLYPNASTIALIERFFLTYLTWNWPTPVRLQNSEILNDIHSWTTNKEIIARENNIKPQYDLLGNLRNKITSDRLFNHSKLIMPIITPIYPEQSAAFNVNYSTHKIILETLFDGYKMIRDVNIVGLRQGAIARAWERWIKGNKFTEKVIKILYYNDSL